jgi:Hypothetical glycosyl hydrolase family 15
MGILGALLLISLSAVADGLAAKKAGRKGAVKVVRNALTDFDHQLRAAQRDTSLRKWMKRHYWQMRGYDPFFANHTFKANPPWKPPPTQAYRNLYALYRDSSGAIRAAHPNWVLRNASNPNEQLYIPWGCGDAAPGCPAFAADLGSPGFRNWWIQQARSVVRRGYVGVAIDDVNLGSIHTGNAAGTAVLPLDPRTGGAMTLANWRRYTAEFVERIDAAFPNKQLTVNANQWWVPHDNAAARIARAVDFTELERGFNDGGIVGGTGTFGYLTLLNHVDWLHAHGGSVMYRPYSLNPISREFELASYFLVKQKADAIVAEQRADRSNWWPGWDTYLGKPSGPREVSSSGMLSRDFAGGSVFVNQPGAPARAESLPDRYRWTDLEGRPVSSITLGPRRGAVLFKRGDTKLHLRKPDCTQPGTQRRVSVKGRVTDDRGKRLDPGYVNRVVIELRRRTSGPWTLVSRRKRALRRKNATFVARFGVGTLDSGTYRASVRFKGNARYFPARARTRSCSY